MAGDTRSFLIICSYFSFTLSDSFLNIEELTSAQYGLEITNKPVLWTDPPLSPNTMYLSSKHGQAYSCLLPQLDFKGDGDDSNKDLKMDDIVKFLDNAFNGTCLTYTKGWWSYKFCHKKNIEQFHIGDNGAVDESLTLLGLYASEDDWSKKKSLDQGSNLYHTQFYENGSMCDLTKNPRKAIVQYYCSDHQRDQIIRVEEPSTCEYIITVHSSKLCTHPLFKIKEKTKQIDLVCSPALREQQYSKYLSKLEKQKADEEEAKKKLKTETDLNKKKLAEGKVKTNNDAGLSSKKIWEEAANEANKFVKILMKTFDTDTQGSIHVFDTTNNPFNKIFQTIAKDKGDSDGNDESETDSSTTHKKASAKIKDSIVEDKLTLKTDTDGLTDQVENTRKVLRKEYAKMRETALQELERSQTLLKTIKNLHKLAQTEEERNEAKNMMDSLEVNIESFHKQIKRIEKHIADIGRLEEITRHASLDMDGRGTSDEKHKRIVDSVSDVMKNIKQVKHANSNLHNENEENEIESKDSFTIHDGNENEKLSNYFKNLADDSKVNHVEDDDGALKNVFEKINSNTGDSLHTDSDQEHDHIKDKELTLSFEDSMKQIRNFMESTFKDDERKIKDEKEKFGTDNVDEMDEKEEEEDSVNSLGGLVGVLKKQINKLNNKRAKEIVDGEKDKDVLDEETKNSKRNNILARFRSPLHNAPTDDLEKDDENSDEEVNAVAKKMEEALSKQLKEAGLDLKNEVKIKIITTKDKFEKFNEFKGGNLLNDNEANDLKDLLLGFLGGGEEKVKEEKRSKSLESNYNFVWDEEDEKQKEDS